MEKLNRWIYVVIGVVILMFAGLIYAWSVMSKFIEGEFTTWSNMQLTLTFTICMTFFCLGGLIGGMMQKKIAVRINILISAGLFLAGFYIASQSSSLITLYVGYGVLCGFGSGLSYNGVISTVSKWFLDKQGLVSGILLMGFGIGSFIMGKMFQRFTPNRITGWRTSFFVLGIVIFIVLIIGSNFIRNPQKQFIDEILSKSKKLHNKEKSNKLCEDNIGDNKLKKDIKEVKQVEFKPSEMIKRLSFWFYFTWSTLLGATGLILISQAMGIAVFVGKNIDMGIIVTVVGLISILNAIGRVVCGALYDKYGRLVTMNVIVIVMVISAIALMLSIFLYSFVLVILGFCMCGFSYGGVTSTNSAFINSFYGSENYPVNFSINNLNLIIASFGSTLAGFVYDISSTYIGIFILMIFFSIISYICVVNIKQP